MINIRMHNIIFMGCSIYQCFCIVSCPIFLMFLNNLFCYLFCFPSPLGCVEEQQGWLPGPLRGYQEVEDVVLRLPYLRGTLYGDHDVLHAKVDAGGEGEGEDYNILG